MAVAALSLKNLDANALVSLDGLLQTQSVTAAARRQGVTQSAMSQTLRRLREVFDDELLVRSGAQMVPTPRALALREPLHRILAELERAIADEPRFDPATSVKRLQIGLSDYAATLLLPGLLARVAREAPGIDVAVVSLSPATMLDALREGTLDLAVGLLGEGTGLDVVPVWRDTFALLVRKGHPLARRRGRLDAFVRARHLLVSPQGAPRGRVDDILSAQGKARRVCATLPYFLAAPAIVADSDLVLTLPRKIAERFARTYGLVVREPPIDAGSFSMAMITASRLRADPANRWLRELVGSVAASL